MLKNGKRGGPDRRDNPVESGKSVSRLVLETVMLVSFGLSWFVKGRKDPFRRIAG